jgi:hypothetical protein
LQELLCVNPLGVKRDEGLDIARSVPQMPLRDGGLVSGGGHGYVVRCRGSAGSVRKSGELCETKAGSLLYRLMGIFLVLFFVK